MRKWSALVIYNPPELFQKHQSWSWSENVHFVFCSTSIDQRPTTHDFWWLIAKTSSRGMLWQVWTRALSRQRTHKVEMKMKAQAKIQISFWNAGLWSAIGSVRLLVQGSWVRSQSGYGSVCFIDQNVVSKIIRNQHREKSNLAFFVC